MNRKDYEQYFLKWYFSDSIELLDKVLTDDEFDPNYSAITAYERLKMYVEYMKMVHKDFVYISVDDILQNGGYDENDIRLLHYKMNKESNL